MDDLLLRLAAVVVVVIVVVIVIVWPIAVGLLRFDDGAIAVAFAVVGRVRDGRRGGKISDARSVLLLPVVVVVVVGVVVGGLRCASSNALSRRVIRVSLSRFIGFVIFRRCAGFLMLSPGRVVK